MFFSLVLSLEIKLSLKDRKIATSGEKWQCKFMRQMTSKVYEILMRA